MGPESPNYTGNWVNVLGRLAPGVTPDQAREELQTVFARWRQDYGYNTTFGNTATVVPIQEAVTTNVRQSMLLLMGAVLLTLLVATSNLASLLLNRALTRNQELAIRGALGARPGRILRQLLTESTVITSVGGALGVAFSVWGVHAIVGILPDSTPRIEYVALDARVLVFSVVLILLTGWAAGILPGLQLRHPAFSSLHAASRGASESRARRGLRSSLVVTELALSVVLLVGSGVLLRSLGAMNSVDTGLQPDRLLTFGLWPASEINARGPDGINQYYARVLDALSALPSVESSAAIHVLPVSGSGWNSSIEVEGRVTPPDAPYVGVWWRPITPGYFETTGMQLSTGRSFVPQDNAGSPWVGIINESMARRFWPTEDPIGKRFTYGLEGNEQLITVVGVVGNVKHLGITSETPPTLYRPFAQAGIRLNAMNVVGRWIVVRAVGNPEDVMDDVRRTVVATIPETPIVNLRPMTTVIQRSLADPRALSILLTLFAAAAVVLGAIGLYGVVAYTVRQRTRELGIRIALGASGGDVTASVIRQGLGYAAVGLPLGLLGAWVGSRAVADMLFQVSPTDPVTYVGVSLVLLVTVMAATIAPASQASKTDPLISLRAE
jgi:putative ABC transport system permease protein